MNNMFSVPTVAERPGNFADRLGAQLGVDAWVGRWGAALTKFYPTPTNSDTSNHYFGSAAAPVTLDEYLIRGDWNVT